MKCNQARSLLIAYREAKQGSVETSELDAHLEQCETCRHFLAQQSVVGEYVRLLPALEPAPHAHANLMNALAAEHAQFLQRSSHTRASSASSVPDFLKPYMKEQIGIAKKNVHSLKEFSTAETGPIPVVRVKPKKRVAPFGQFAVLGLAASILLVFLVGGLVLLLATANHGVTETSQVVSISHPSLIAPVSYTAETPYTHIGSAVSTHNHIYYSAYDDDAQWMIEQIDGTVRDTVSVPLLKESNDSQLFVLSASSDWLVWLQMDNEQTVAQKHTDEVISTRNWDLNILPLKHSTDTAFGDVTTLLHGTFDTSTVPSWVHTPVQGISFIQEDTLLVTSLDVKGSAQIAQYQLHTDAAPTATVISTTSNGHVFTSPTATDDGTRIFWSEEWFTSDQQPHSLIWVQDTTAQVVYQDNAWRPDTIEDTYVYSTDDTSFHPQVINDTLFVLSTSSTATSTQSRPIATSTPSLQPTANAIATTQMTSRFTSLYEPQIDESILGTVLAIPLDDPSAQPTTLSNNSTAAGLQGGTRFVLWQNSSGYQMYDAVAKSSVEVKDSTNNATFLTVNGATAVWEIGNSLAVTKDTASTPTVTFNMFNWPA